MIELLNSYRSVNEKITKIDIKILDLTNAFTRNIIDVSEYRKQILILKKEHLSYLVDKEMFLNTFIQHLKCEFDAIQKQIKNFENIMNQ